MTITSAKTLYIDGSTQITELLRITGVNSGDTIDVSVVGQHSFGKVTAAAFIGANQGTAVAGGVAGTVITLTSVGLTTDTVDLLVLGI